MIIRAELKCKQTGCEADPCAVDKVIELPSPRFRLFSRALLADYDFIAENKNAIRHDEDARHCLLILDAEGKDGFLVDPQGYNYARYSAFVPNARSLLTPDMGIDRSYLSPAEPWRDESRDEMLRMTLRVDGKPDYTLVLPADEDYLDAVKNYLDIDVFADALLCDIRFKVPYIGELICDTDCPAVEDYNDFAEALEGIWQKDGMLLTYAAVLEAERPDTLRGACELLRNLDNYQRITEGAYGYGQQRLQETLGLDARLSLNGEKIGLTSSCDIGVEVFPEDPSSTEEQYYMLDGKTILIESDLMKEGANIGRRNYTVSHESCHHILKMLFPHDYGAQASGRSVHCCYRSNRGNGDWEEWQVETLAAMILLPPECVVRSMERFGLGTQMRLLNRVFAPADYKKFEAMASFMGASKTALSIRMMQLGLLKRNDLSDPYSLVRVEMDEEDRIL